MRIEEHILNLLYDYLLEEMSEKERLQAEVHLQHCEECNAECDKMQSTLERLSELRYAPSTERSSEFWSEFPIAVGRRLQANKPGGRALHWVRWWGQLLYGSPRYRIAGALIVLAVGTVFVMKWNAGEKQISSIPDKGKFGIPLELVDQRAQKYFRQSGVLMVELANRKHYEGKPTDLSLERRVSRQLLNEARFLKQQPLTPYTTQLMSDIEPVLIELANSEHHSEKPTVELLRDGIFQGNLLFKVRMAQIAYDSTTRMRIQYASMKE
ncbi:MAG TPA: zf-HC2 domain-containing protein [Bacteroidota bacterium]